MLNNNIIFYIPKHFVAPIWYYILHKCYYSQPHSYGVVRYTIESQRVSEISKVTHRDDFP